MVTGRVRVDISKWTADPYEDERNDRHALMVLDTCPDGATVTVHVGRRRYFGRDVTRLLAAHEARLNLELVGTDPEVVNALIVAARGGASWIEPLVPVPTRRAS